MKYKILILGLLIMVSCKKEGKLEGEYFLDKDLCKSIHIIGEKIKYKRNCEESKDLGIHTTKLSGEKVILFCGGELDYEVDRIDKNNGIYLRTKDKNNEICRGYHIINEDDYIVLTELKKGKGIDFHFTEPQLFIKKGRGDLKVDSTKLIIEIPKGKEEGINYIAYNQKDGNEIREDERGNTYLKFGASIKLKTPLEINPKHYALKTYEFIEMNESSRKELPIIYHREYQTMRNKSPNEQAKYMKERGIEKGEKYVILYRFNPGRKRTVNKVFESEIKGQVQSFELLKY